MTLEALGWLERADKLLFLVADPVMESWIRDRNPTAETLADHYVDGKPRSLAYRAMVDRILSYVRQGLQVVVALYGHPGVFADPSHAAIRLARREGYRAEMLAGVSAEDCLFAELGVDPGDRGCQSYEATDFLNRRPRFDPSCVLILWQIGVIGEDSIPQGTNVEGLRELVQVLQRYYGPDHRVVVYEACYYPICESLIRRVPLGRVTEINVPVMSTLYVPPRRNTRRRKRA